MTEILREQARAECPNVNAKWHKPLTEKEESCQACRYAASFAEKRLRRCIEIAAHANNTAEVRSVIRREFGVE